MKKWLIILAVCSLFASCGKPKSFEVKVEAQSLGTQLMTIVYRTESGDRVVQTVPAVEGKFEFTGSSSSPAIVELFTNNKMLYSALIATNGEKISLTESPKGEKIIAGSDLSQRLLKLGKDYCDTTDYSGEDVAVREALSSIYAMVSMPDTLRFVSPQVYIRRDSVTTFPSEGIWIFTADADERTEALIDSLKEYHKGKLPVRDIWIGVDTTQWRMVTRRDTAKWTQGMVPDAPLMLKGIVNSTPLLLEVDSAGTVLRRQKL